MAQGHHHGGRVPLGHQDRGDIHDWVHLMHLLGVTPPAKVQAYIDDPRQKVTRQQAKRGVVAAAPGLTSAPLTQSAYDARLANYGGGTAPAGAQSYKDYSNADDFARMGNYSDPALVSRYTVPTQYNGIPNVIPQGARITYQGAQQPPPLTVATRGRQRQRGR
jgi:hypothetical protein